MNINFNNISKLDARKDRSITYPLYQLDGEASVLLLPAAESNKRYFNALLRQSRQNMRAVQNKQVNAGVIQNNRNQDRALYAEHVITSWEGIVDADGTVVPFTKEACLDFLTALPDWIFDEIRTFASDIRNFIEYQIDSEEVAKNS